MKTIEDKADAYIEKHQEDFYQPLNPTKKTNPQIMKTVVTIDDVRAAYLAGAKEALAGQWRDAEKEKPEDGEEILMAKLIIPPASRALRTPLIGYIADKFRSEYEHGGFGYSEVTHWLPIPELPTLKPTEK